MNHTNLLTIDSDYIVPRRANLRTPHPHLVASSFELKYLNDTNKKVNKTKKLKEFDMKLQILNEILRFKKAQHRFMQKTKQFENETVVEQPSSVALLNVSAHSIPKVHVFYKNPNVTLGHDLEPFANIIIELMNHVYAAAFNTPVDYARLNIPDYPQKIKKPMDLGTIKFRLENGKYERPEEIIKDIRLVWENSQTYNPPGNQFNTMARLLSEMFESRLKETGFGDGKRPTTVFKDIGFGSKASSKVNGRLRAHTKKPYELSDSDFEPETGAVIELSIFEREELKKIISAMTDAKILDSVASIIRSDPIYKNSKIDSSKLEFDVNSLSAKASRELYKLIQSFPELKQNAIKMKKIKHDINPSDHLKQIDTKISNEFGTGRAKLIESVKSNRIINEKDKEKENIVEKEESKDVSLDKDLEKYCASIIQESSSSSEGYDSEDENEEKVRKIDENHSEKTAGGEKVMWNWKPQAAKRLKVQGPTPPKPLPTNRIPSASKPPPSRVPIITRTANRSAVFPPAPVRPFAPNFATNSAFPNFPRRVYYPVMRNGGNPIVTAVPARVMSMNTQPKFNQKQFARLQREKQGLVGINLQQKSFLSLQKRFE